MRSRKRELMKGRGRKILALMLSLMVFCSMTFTSSVYAAEMPESDEIVQDADLPTDETNTDLTEAGETEVADDSMETDSSVTEIDGSESVPVEDEISEEVSEEESFESIGGEETEVAADEITENSIDAVAMEEIVATDEIMPLEGEIPEDDPNFIILQKTFKGLKKEEIPAGFQISVTQGTITYTKGLNDAIDTNPEPNAAGEIIYKWKIVPINPGKYTVSESGCTVKDYSLVADVPEGEISVEAADMGIGMATFVPEKPLNHYPVQGGRFFVAKLNGNEGTFVFTEHPLTYSQRLAVQKFLETNKNFNGWKYDLAQGQLHCYSYDEQYKDGSFIFRGQNVEYKDGEMWFGDENKSQWAQVATLTYDIGQAVNPEIVLTNTYIPQIVPVTIEKDVTGNMGDRTKEFSFAVTSDKPMADDKTSVEFTLKDGDSISLKDVKKGSTLTIKETNAEGYAKTVTINGIPLAYDETTDSYTYTIPSDADTTTGIKILVENNKNIIIDTGVVMDSLPYIVILAIVVIGAVFFLKRSKSRKDA